MFENITQYLNNISIITYVIVFMGGVATSFTPCVYPIIPIIVGVIGSNKESSKLRNFFLSLCYAAGMALTFSALGVTAVMTGRMFGQVQTCPVVNLAVGNVIIIFALVLLDVITLPTYILSRAGAGRVVKGGSAVPAFLMGAASGFVAAPCTAAVLGALLSYVATTRNVALGFSLLFTFAMGLGSILVVIGTFTGVVTAFKKFDKWMHAVQKVIAFGMILIGEYFIYRAGMLGV